MISQKDFLNKAEDYADEVTRHSKHILPYIARFCLISTFVEDGFRMWFQWKEQRDYMSSSWGFGTYFGTIFVIINLLGQLIPSGFILVQKHTKIAVCALFGIVLMQTIAYNIFWDLRFFLRNVAVCGGLCLILAEAHSDNSKPVFAGVPSVGGNKPKSYFQLAGRILLAMMFATLTNIELTPISLIMLMVSSALMILVMIGYKTKLSALALVVWLTCLNLYVNNWWNQAHHSYVRDFLKYDFFQTMSVIGGLLLIVSLGPGGVSLDEHKKRW